MYTNFLVGRSGEPREGMPVLSNRAKMGKKVRNTKVTHCLYGCLWWWSASNTKQHCHRYETLCSHMVYISFCLCHQL